MMLKDMCRRRVHGGRVPSWRDFHAKFAAQNDVKPITCLFWMVLICAEDVSQAGFQAGVHGSRSSLVGEAFKTFDSFPEGLTP